MLDKLKAAIFVVTFCVSGNVYSAPLDIKKIENAINSVRTQAILPKLIAEPEAPIQPSSIELSPEIKQIFSSIQKKIFGTDQFIALKSCDGCIGVANAHEMTVYLDPNFLNSIQEKLEKDSHAVTFIISHEIAHFTYEYAALLNNGVSTNGNILLLTKTFVDYTNMNEYLAGTPDVQKRLVDDYSARGSRSHAEVDAFAILTLRLLGIDISTTAKHFLAKEAIESPEEAARADFAVRSKIITETFKSYGR